MHAFLGTDLSYNTSSATPKTAYRHLCLHHAVTAVTKNPSNDTRDAATMRLANFALILAGAATTSAFLTTPKSRPAMRSSPLLTSSRLTAPVVALTPESLQELPTKKLLKAIAACGNTATAADVAAASGLSVAETRRQLLNLARLVGAELQVSADGELLFVFDEPGKLKGGLRSASVRQRASDVWDKTKPPLFWVLRASFGLGLLASLTLVTVAITALASSSKDNDSSGTSALSVTRLWGPSPFDFLYYSSRPYGYYDVNSPRPQEKGFLQSCFSLLFGDGNPNANLAQRTSIAAAAIIRANGGAVTAEQLAPLLAPEIDPDRADEDSARPGAPVSESWMLPILLQFNGEPVVTDEGDLVYVFPELMATASDGDGADGSLAAAAARAELMAAASGGGGALATAGISPQQTAQCLAFTERPTGWRPRIGELVVVGDISRRRRQDEQIAASRLIGSEGAPASTLAPPTSSLPPAPRSLIE